LDCVVTIYFQCSSFVALRVKMISLKETDLSEANVAAQLGLPKS
jgi:hypothetical protein